MAVRLHTCVPPPPRLPSVCEINVVWVWSVLLLLHSFATSFHRRVERPVGLHFMSASLAFQFIHTVSALDSTGPGWVPNQHIFNIMNSFYNRFSRIV